MTSKGRGAWLDGVAALCLIVAAWLARRPMLAAFHVTGDAIGPWRGAWEVLGGHLPGPHNPGFGGLLPVLHAPLLLGADGLEGALLRRFALHALVVGVLYLALGRAFARWTARPWAARAGALVAAVAFILAREPGFALESGNSPYLAPDLAILQVACVALAIGGGRLPLVLAGALLPLLAAQHPYALCFVPALAVLCVHRWRRGALEPGAMGLLLPFVAAALFVQRRALASLVGAGDSLAPGRMEWSEVVSTATHPDLALLSPVLLLGPLALGAVARTDAARAFARWALIAQGGLMGAATALAWFRPWHWTIVHPVLAASLGAAVAVGLARLPSRLAVALPAVCVLCLVGGFAAEPGRPSDPSGDLDAHRALVATLGELPAHIVALDGTPRPPSSEGLQLLARLQGLAPATDGGGWIVARRETVRQSAALRGALTEIGVLRRAGQGEMALVAVRVPPDRAAAVATRLCALSDELCGEAAQLQDGTGQEPVTPE